MGENRNFNNYMKESIMFSLVDLLEKKNLDNITIVEIINHAGVSRNSFYRNFDSKDDILVQYAEFITQKYILLNDGVKLESKREVLVYFLEDMYKYHETIEMFLKNDKLYLVLKIIEAIIKSIKIDNCNLTYCNFISGGILNVFLNWSLSGYTATVDELADSIVL